MKIIMNSSIADINKEAVSFSSSVKQEILRSDIGDECCTAAAFMGAMLFGAVRDDKDIRIISENSIVLDYVLKLSDALGLCVEVSNTDDISSKVTAQVSGSRAVYRFILDSGLLNNSDDVHINYDFIKNECCTRAFVKGAFMGAGTISDPNKNYNLELTTQSKSLCDDAMKLFKELGFDFGLILRKNKYVMYMKNSGSILDMLSFMGAYKSQMELLNIKIEKEIRNDLNRSANGETSNLIKTINASVDQIRAIQKIENTVGLDSLPDELREIAYLRLNNKDLSLGQLGSLLNPPLTKSGVNHRMKKILNYLD